MNGFDTYLLYAILRDNPAVVTRARLIETDVRLDRPTAEDPDAK